MKKLMLSFAAVAAFVSVASAEDAAWFTGTIGSETGGKWTMNPGDGSITTNSNTRALKLEDAAASFTATTPKAADSSQNLNFATSAMFTYSYDELPEIEDGAKAGVVVYTDEYYVLAKDGTTNNWVSTGVDATLDSAVDVSVTISNDNSSVYAIYNIDGTSIIKEVVASGNWSVVDYSGSGEVASLVGTTISLSSGWPLPGGGSIEVDPAWAAANNIDQAAFADPAKLSNGFSASESYILGLNTNETLKSTYTAGDGGFKIGLAQTARDAGRVTYDIYSGDSVLAESVTLPYKIADRGDNLLKDGRFKICPVVTGQTASGYSTVIGIKATDQISHNSCSFLAVPFECVPSNFLWVAWSESRVDTMGVYDAESEQWDTYLSKGSNTTVWNYVAPAPYRAPITTVLRPGQAIKLNCGDQGSMGTSRYFYIIGEVVPATTTAIVDGKWNLVGTPDGNPIQCSKLPEDALVKLNSDLDMLPSTSFYKYKGAWYRQLLNKAAEPVEYIGKIGEVKNSEARGFYLKSAATSIQW